MANLETWLAEENSIIQKPDNEKQVYLHEWLERLDEHLRSGNASNEEIKKIQPKIVSTLHKILEINCSPATRLQLAKCFATIYNMGTTLGLFDSVNKCIDLVKSRDDSSNNLPIKLSAICCMGGIYGALGRMVGTLFDSAMQSLSKLLCKSEPQAKCEILHCFQRMLYGLGNAASTGFKDIYKACKSCLVDKSMSVRWAAAKCALELSKNATFLCTTDLDAMVTVCLKALEGSNYDVRVQVAQLLGILMAGSQAKQMQGAKGKKISIEDMFGIMAAGFLKGGTGFLKGGGIIESGMNREVRVGVTQAYVVFFHEMGTKWVAKYLAGIIIHILELAASQKATTSHIDAVYSRKCVSFILNSVLCGMLPERLQVQAVKELCKIIIKQMNNIDNIVVNENNADNAVNVDIISTQHVLVCALAELSKLVLALTSSVKSIMDTIIVEAVFSTLIHPAPAVWLSAAWCIRCCSIALPSSTTNLIDMCLNKIKNLRSSPSAVTGYGYTLAAIVGGLHQCPLGIPYTKAKVLFTLSQDLLKTSNKGGKLASCKIQTGWILLGSLCTLGSSVMKNYTPSMIQLWTSAFPALGKDVEKEKERGNLRTWQLTFENRDGALCSMASFVTHCKSLVVPEVEKKLLIPVEAALSSLSILPGLVKLHGTQLQPSIAMFKLRLHQLLCLLPPKLFEGSFSLLLRDLVAEFTLADRKGSTTTSLLQSLCHKDDSILLGSWLQETDHKEVEEQLQLNSASGSGALEHDSACIYAKCEDQRQPGPLPLGVAVIDSAISSFGHIFPFVTHKHRGQLMNHFNECIDKNKGSRQRQQAIQTNIFSAFLAALKNLADNKTMFGEDSVRSHANTLVQDALANSDNILRCAAGEALGRIAQVVNDESYMSKIAQTSFEKCQKNSDVLIRTGHALALGCLHRYVGGMGSGHHLNNSISILIALAKDTSSALVQMWSLHGLTQIADSGGPMFRPFVDQSLYTTINLLLRTPPSMTEVHQCLGKCFGALITAIGPELQDTSKTIVRWRMFCMTACSIMQNHPDSLVQAEAICCLQKLHLFAPNVVNLHTLIPHLCKNLLSPHLILRQACVDCLRQLAHREAKDICDLGRVIIENNDDVVKKMYISNRGLEGLLFSLLDAEVDQLLLKHIHETITSMLQALAAKDLKHWLGLCKQVLLASNVEEEATPSSNADDDDDEEGGNIVVNSSKSDDTQVITPKWPTRVFAMECTRMILQECKGYPKHMDLFLARKMKEENPSEEFLVTQLTELVRLAFIAGTSVNDLLKLEGMKALQDVVLLFAKVPDPDIQGHLILEQFQAQVGTALRPAFADNVPPNVTAMACEVCSSWIGCGISRDINDVRRIQQLLVSSLEKIDSSGSSTGRAYSESSYTLETLIVLKAWAQIYIMAMKHENAGETGVTTDPTEDEYSTPGRLLDLVEKDLPVLVKHWVGATRDYVLLSLPVQFAPQLPPDGGAFYSGESVNEVRSHYKQNWSPWIHAIALWLNSVAFKDQVKTIIDACDEKPPCVKSSDPQETLDEINRNRFHLISGICVEAMSSPLSTYPSGTVETCVYAMDALLESPFGRSCIVEPKQLSIELLTVLHRLLLTHEDSRLQQTILDIVYKCTLGLYEHIHRKPKTKEEVGVKTKEVGVDGEDDEKAEGEGEAEEVVEDADLREHTISSKKSIVFSVLEICCFMVTRYAKSVIPEEMHRKTGIMSRKQEFGVDLMGLISSITSILSNLPDLCTAEGSVTCLPTVMFLSVSCWKYIAQHIGPAFTDCTALKTSFGKIIRNFKKLICCEHTKNEKVVTSWESVIHSALLSLHEASKTWSMYEKSMDASCATLLLWEHFLLLNSIFVMYSPNQAICETHLLRYSIEIFSNTLQNAPAKLRLPALKVIESMVKCPEADISTPFISQCLPCVVGVLVETYDSIPTSDTELSVCKECIALFELVLAMIDDKKRIHLLSVYCSCLVKLLYDSTTLSKANSFSRSLHEHCIQRLTGIGRLYPALFKQCMAESANLKEKLTAGIKANQSIQTVKSPSANSKAFQPQQPQIKLKMDFSNFK